MRLFIAVNFEKEVKDEIFKAVMKLKESSLSGNFTLYDNLHITLLFLGEVESTKADIVKKVMGDIDEKPFELIIGGLRKFNDIYYLAVRDENNLRKINNRLTALKDYGFIIEERKFTPHITLGRRVMLRKDVGDYNFFDREIKAEIKSFQLMNSERVKGVLTYSQIFSVPLK